MEDMPQPDKIMKCNDITDEILAEPGDFTSHDTTSEDDMLPEFDITIDIATLNSKPSLKSAIINGLDPEGKMDEIMSDELIVETINTFPEIRSEYIKLFYDIDYEEEGEPTYFPSILDVDDAEEMMQIMEISGFRESKDEIAHKYMHLSEESVNAIYGNPKIRKILCRMKSKDITDELVASFIK
jgi:hypothetical protein